MASSAPFSTAAAGCAIPAPPSRSSEISFVCQSKQLLFLRRVRNHRRRLLSARPFSVKAVASDREVKDSASEGLPQSPALSPYDSASIASSIKYHAEFTPSFSPERFELPKAYHATAESVRDALIINWNATYDHYEKINAKQAYYLSMEFLQGRALLNAIGNLELTGEYADALKKLGHTLETVASQEPDAALGNGGLGRLASCFLDSLATLNYPAWGYGLRYKYGLFQQHITKDGQEEVAESWLEMGNPWEIVRHDVSYPVKFYGKVVVGSDGKKHWIGGENIQAVAYDVPIPGYRTRTTINLRLWSTKVPAKDFDLHAFNSGDHAKAVEAQTNAEKICYILYPGDDSLEGKSLRLKQQYTLCSASLQDIIARFERRSGASINWEELPDKVAVQMNDTHPTLCIPELIRILVDLKGLSFQEAWKITQRTVAYTNHTVLPEALEKWSYDLMQKLLPRHIEIIEMIDEELLQTIITDHGTADLQLLEKKLNEMRVLENFEFPDSVAKLFVKPKKVAPIKTKGTLLVKEVEISGDLPREEEIQPEQLEEETVEEEPEVPKRAAKSPKLVRMANLCVVGGHAVNGVAEIHSEIVKNDVFNNFYKLWPEKFQNKTNGVTPRRWIRFCNPDLSRVITKWIGTEDWVLNTEKLAELRKFADNEDLQHEWREAKRNNKLKVASFIKDKTGYAVSPDAMFDIQVKRIHEYKRQLLNILGIVYRYKKMKEMSAKDRLSKFAPRVCIFGGKAFATYVQAKRIVKFITDVGDTVNHDPEIGDLLKEEVYMEQPPGYVAQGESQKVCRLRKAIYGLKQSPRAWFEKFSTALLQFGFSRSATDHSLFVLRSSRGVIVLAVYVDDIVITGDDQTCIAQLKTWLQTQFQTKDLGKLRYFLGIEVLRSKTGVNLSQRKYVLDLLDETGMLNCKPVSTPMDYHPRQSTEADAPFFDITKYRRIVGKLIYLTVTRQNISYSVGVVSQHMSTPMVSHWTTVMQILRYLKGAPGKGLTYLRPQSVPSEVQVIGYADADWVGDSVDRRSTSGYCVFLGSHLVT